MEKTTPEQTRPSSWSSWDEWLNSPPGQYVLKWQQSQFDHIVSDIFGYHALQIGLPQLQGLKENRMPLQMILKAPHDRPDEHQGQTWQTISGLPDKLPFADQSIDLVLLPHVLEFAEDPHAVLREVNRILLPEGRVVITGFNPASMWGLRQYCSHLVGQPYLPREGQFIDLIRIKDWLKLLDFSVDRGRFGCYRLPLRSESGMTKMGFLEEAGDRWWPVLGSVFMVSAIKRVSTLTMVGLIDTGKTVKNVQLNPVTNLQGHQSSSGIKSLESSE